MKVLFRLINQMVSLGYTKEGVIHYITLLRAGTITAKTLFIIMNFEEPGKLELNRFNRALRKADLIIETTFREEI